LLAPIAGPEPVQTDDSALRLALDHAFDEAPSGPRRHTQAVVVVHRDRIIAERYAPGIGVDTPLPGWSATKSVTIALLGVLVRQGRLDMNAPAPIPAWSDPRDPRHAITPDQLLRMTSGLDAGQSLHDVSAFDPSAQMLFVEHDMAAFAARAPLAHTPDTHWTTPTRTRCCSRASFATWLAATQAACLGLLYLNDGVVGGERLLPPGWVDYSARQTPGAENVGYAAGFWTNRSSGYSASYRIAAGMPADAFMARGSYGQYVVIVPSQQLVVVRLGPAWTTRNDRDAVARLTRELTQALPSR